MAGYTRQSAAQIISGEVVSASPLNAEFNQVLAAFNNASGHKHDGTASEGPPIDRVADADQKNAILVDSSNNELEFYVEQGGAAEKQLSIKHEIIEPTTDNNIDLGSSTKVFRNAYVNAINVGSTGGTFASVDINGGTIDGTVIGNTTPADITGATVTATQFSGPISGAVTGDVSGNVTGDVTGNLTGNVTATAGQSQFNNVVISGDLNMDAGTTSTITNLSAPSGANDAATKAYVDTEISNLVGTAPEVLDTLGEIATSLGDSTNLASTLTTSIGEKLPLAGGTMTGDITMSQSSKVTGLPTPSAGSDAANKTYADTKLPSASPTVASGPLTLSGAPTQNLHAATKLYVDTVAGSNQQAQTSANQAAASASDAQLLAINPENSQFTLADNVTTGFSALHYAAKAEDSATAAANSFDSFDDIYLGAKSSAPTVDNDGDALQTGALYFDTTAGNMFVYDGSSFVVTGSAVNGTSSRQVYVATAGQTTFAIAHDVGFVDVYINGLKLRTGTDFTDNNVSNIVLASGANLGDIVDIVAFGAFNVANHYTQTQSDARYTRIANNLSELANSASAARANLGAAPTVSPTFTGTVTIPASSLTYAGTSVTATGAELNKLAGATASTAELNFVTGVTSAIQTQLDAKAPLASPNFSGTPQISGSNILTAATAPAGGNTVQLTASGTLANGDPVILNANGTVSAVTGTQGGAAGKTAYVNNNTGINSGCFHAGQNAFVIAYSDNTLSGAGYVVAGTVNASTNTFTFGTPVQFESDNVANLDICYDSGSQLIHIAFTETGNNYPNIRAYSLSGTTLTAATSATAVNGTNSAAHIRITYDTYYDQLVVGFRDVSSSNYARAKAYNYSGGSYTTGGILTMQSSLSYSNQQAYDPVNYKHVHVCAGNNGWPHAYTLTVSGTGASPTLSTSPATQMFGNAVSYFGLEYYPPTQNMVFVYQLNSNSTGYVSIGIYNSNLGRWDAWTSTNSAYIISQGGGYGGTMSNSSNTRYGYDEDNEELIITYAGSGSDGALVVAVKVTPIGAITTRGPQQFDTTASYYHGSVYDTSQNVPIATFHDQGNGNKGSTAIVRFDSTNLTASNFIGFSAGAVADGNTATIQTTGNVSDAQTGLTTVSDYFVRIDGTLNTTADQNYNVPAGKALSATKLLIA